MPQIVAVALCSVLAAVCMFGSGMALNAAQAPVEEQTQSAGSSDAAKDTTYMLGTSELISETGDEARAANIALAAQAIDGTVVDAGGAFSLNDALTAVSARYRQTDQTAGSDDAKPAPGVNQVASALYNAALKAGLSVTERHAGTAAAEYVSTGLEAVINPGTADLKLMNTMDSSVVLKAAAQGQKVTINVVGSAPDSSVKYDVVARIVDGDIGAEYKVESYLVTYKDGVKSAEKKLAEGTYTGSPVGDEGGDANKSADSADKDADEDAASNSANTNSESNTNIGSQNSSGSSNASSNSSSSNSNSSSNSTNPVPSRGGTSPVK